VRFLYIALAAALIGAPVRTAAAADDACLTAADGTVCPDDEDPCTTDHCIDETCTHVDVPSRTTCDPARRRLPARSGSASWSSTCARSSIQVPPPGPRPPGRDALGAAAPISPLSSDALAGRIVVPPPAGETLAQARARAPSASPA
jgi:hypothetical protein